jgi:hypothetical protein
LKLRTKTIIIIFFISFLIFGAFQVFFRKNGEVSYARARHYGADKKFYYHQQTLEYVNRKLIEIGIIDPCQDQNNKSVGQTNLELGAKLEFMAGPKGFEPLTFSLEG